MLTKLRKKIEKSSQQRRAIKQVRKAGFWFVDIPRTSSSSIKAEFGRKFGPAYAKTNLIESEYASPQLIEDHATAVTMRSMLGRESWNKLYTFTFVRNPYDRIASLYHYLRKRNEIPCEWSFSEFVSRLVDADSKTPYFRFHGLRYGAVDFILDRDGAVLVDDVFRYEKRADGIRKIVNKVGIQDLGQLHIQAASPGGRQYRSIYDDQTRELVSARFAADLKLFDYDF